MENHGAHYSTLLHTINAIIGARHITRYLAAARAAPVRGGLHGNCCSFLGRGRESELHTGRRCALALVGCTWMTTAGGGPDGSDL